MSDAVQVHIGHFSSYIGHNNYKMIIKSHWTSDIMSSASMSDIQEQTSDMSDVSDGFWVTLVLVSYVMYVT